MRKSFRRRISVKPTAGPSLPGRQGRETTRSAGDLTLRKNVGNGCVK